MSVSVSVVCFRAYQRVCVCVCISECIYEMHALLGYSHTHTRTHTHTHNTHTHTHTSAHTQEQFYGCKITLADREFVECHADIILKAAQTHNTALLIVGDPFAYVLLLLLVLLLYCY